MLFIDVPTPISIFILKVSIKTVRLTPHFWSCTKSILVRRSEIWACHWEVSAVA